jgi:hypothetical protein
LWGLASATADFAVVVMVLRVGCNGSAVGWSGRVPGVHEAAGVPS